MAPETDRGDTTERKRPADATVVLGRRRLLRGGLGAAPVIMTIASGPVRAGVCTTASAFGSLAPSGTHRTLTCGGRTPSTWYSTPPGQWPCNANSLFSAYFSPALSDPNAKLKNVVNPAGGYDAVARNLVAALLNAYLGLVPASILDAGKAKTIWASYAATASFQPTAGITWNGAQIVDWITTTYS
jgi:hypothetical protein